MPRRPLSAYNLFFRQEREKMLQSGWKTAAQRAAAGKGSEADKSKTGGFANLARTVAAKWKNLPPDEKAPFEKEASREKARYDSQMLGWRAAQEQKKARKLGGARVDALSSGASLHSYAAHMGGLQQMDYPDTWFQATDTPRQDAGLHGMGMKEQQERAFLAQQQQLQLQQQQHHHQQLEQQRFLSTMPEHLMAARGSAFANPLLQSAMDVERNIMQHQMPPLVPMQMAESIADKKHPTNQGKPGGWPANSNPLFSSQQSGSSFELRSEYNQMTRPALMEQRSIRGSSMRGTPLGGHMHGTFPPQFRTLGTSLA